VTRSSLRRHDLFAKVHVVRDFILSFRLDMGFARSPRVHVENVKQIRCWRKKQVRSEQVSERFLKNLSMVLNECVASQG